MISYTESLLPWQLSRKLKPIINYFQCDMMHFGIITKKKITFIPIPVHYTELYNALLNDDVYYKHPSFFLEGYHLLPHALSEVDKFLLMDKEDRVLADCLGEHTFFSQGGNGITLAYPQANETYIFLRIIYAQLGQKINITLKDKKKSKEMVEYIYKEIKATPNLIDQFSYLCDDYDHQMANFNDKGLQFINTKLPSLTVKQAIFAKHLAITDEYSTKGIGYHLGLSDRTIADYFVVLRNKLDTNDKISTILKCREIFNQYWC